MLIRWQKTIVDRRGNVQPGAVLSIRRESDQALVTIYRDRDGLQPYPTGTVTADEFGYAYFYAAPDLYRISSSQPAIDWRDENVGFQDLQQASVTYLTKADMESDTSQPVPTLASVVKDPIEENNAFYVWDGNEWSKSSLNPARLPDIQAVADAAVAQATEDAESYRNQAQQASNTASQAADAARAAAEASGSRRLFDTYAEAEAELGSIPEGMPVEILTDEQNSGAHTLYRVEGGALVFKLNLDYLEERLADGTTPGNGASMVAFSQPDSDGAFRSVLKKLEDVVSVRDYITTPVDGTTSNQAGIEKAVAAALARGALLEWPAGTYVSTQSIPNFHEVRHIGRGVIKRGSQVFHIGARRDIVNTLHVDPSATDPGLDGLSTDSPLKTIGDTFAALQNWGPVLGGRWVVQLAESSSYDYGVVLEGLGSENPITIQGPAVGHPNEPLAVVAPAISAPSGWLFRGVHVLLRDIKFIRFNSNASAYGAGTRDGGHLSTENVHIDDCTLGIVGNGLCVINVKGGIIEGCQEGIRSLFGCYHSIGLQNAGGLENGPIIRNNEVGFSARESSSGHCDWVTFEDNLFGIDCHVNSRVNCGGSDFKRNTVAIRSRSANVLAPRTGAAACTFNDGTVDANGQRTRLYNFADDLGQFPYANTTAIITRDFSGVTLTGTTAQTNLKSQTIERGDYLALAGGTYLGKHIRMLIRGNMLGTAGTKNLRVLLGETLVSGLLSPAVSGRFEMEVCIYFTNRTVQRTLARLSVSGQHPIYGGSSTAVDMGAGGNIDLTLQGALSSASDSIIVDFLQLDIDG